VQFRARFALMVALMLPKVAFGQLVVYDNLTNPTGFAFANGGANNQGGNLITRFVADRLQMDPGGAGQTASQWSFSVSSQSSTIVSTRVLVRFFDDDGPGGTPGSLIAAYTYPAASFSLGSALVTKTDPFAIPADGSFWAGIAFDNDFGATGATLGLLNGLGQDIYNPPTIGSSADNYFLGTGLGDFTSSNPAGSALNFGGSPVANFRWQVQVVPEPTSLVLAGAAAAGWLVRRRYVAK